MAESQLPETERETSFSIEGGCHCGKIRYQARGPAFRLTHCHCTICRAFGGTLMSWITVDHSSYRMINGTPEPYHSSANGQREFCGNCGAHLTFSCSREPETIDIAIGTLDKPGEFAPDNQVWGSERLPFIFDIASLPMSMEGGDVPPKGGAATKEAGPDDVEIRDNRDIHLHQIIELYKANRWSSAEKPELLYRALMNSSTLISAWRGDKLVGLANAITDGNLVVYYPHMLVDPACQGEGIGRLIMEEMLERYGHMHQQILTADSSAAKFYLKCGFVRAGQAVPMWIYAGGEH